MAIDLILADDHALFRSGLRELLQKASGLRVVGEAADGAAAIEQVAATDAAVVLMDLYMPGMDGLTATRRIRRRWPGKQVVGLSAQAAARDAGPMLEAGAAGYLLKTAAMAELVRAVRTVAGGEVYLGQGVAGPLIERYVRGHGHNTGTSDADGLAAADYAPSHNGRAKPTLTKPLTAREQQVLQMIAEGQSLKQIAAELGLSVKTIEAHRATIMRKLDRPTVAHLTRYAIQEGLVALDG